MLQAATVRLTLAYLAIVMTISVIFSLVLYNVSEHEIASSLRRQLPVYEEFQPAFGDSVDFRTFESIEESAAKHRLQLRLVLANVVILMAAGAGCFWMARRTLDPIEKAFEAQSRFSADASHELRTPLTAMKAEIEVALRDKKLSAAEARELLGSNLEEIAKLESLANGLLRLARHERADESTVEAVSLAVIAAGAMKRVSARAEDRNVTFTNTTGNEFIAGDQEHLIELVAILLDNAVKYGPKNGMVRLSSSLQKNTATLTIQDQGEGIREVDLPHIFDRFYRADSSRSRDGAGGYGLGLSIARQIATSYNGTLTAANNADGGAIFTLRMPLTTEDYRLG